MRQTSGPIKGTVKTIVPTPQMDIYPDMDRGQLMSNAAQKRAIRNYRSRQAQSGITRFEIQALDTDRELIRALARRLTGDGPEATQARMTVQQIVFGEPPRQGRILQALRRSPLVGADLDLDRAREEGRRVDL